MTFENKPQIPQEELPNDIPEDVDGVEEAVSVDLEMNEEEKRLNERPTTGYGALLDPFEGVEVRNMIRSNPRLNEYYEKGRKTLTGGKSGYTINRGQLINQLEIELASSPVGEFEAQDELRKIIRSVIAKSENQGVSDDIN